MKKRLVRTLLLATFYLMTGISQPQAARACPNSPEDETIIEYFNEIEFSEDIYLLIVDTGTQFDVSLSCPPQESPYFPPQDFLLSLYPSDNSTVISCNTGQIQLIKSEMRQLAYCQTNGITCSFLVILSNRQTQGVYCSTELMLSLINGNNTYIPNLNPATIPICPQNFNPCVLTGQCTLNSDHAPALTLCESGECTAPPANKTYSYNENIYFSPPTE